MCTFELPTYKALRFIIQRTRCHREGSDAQRFRLFRERASTPVVQKIELERLGVIRRRGLHVSNWKGTGVKGASQRGFKQAATLACLGHCFILQGGRFRDVGGRIRRDVGRNGDFQFGARPSLAPYAELCADTFGPLVHSQKAPV